jgi:hypothetical protein
LSYSGRKILLWASGLPFLLILVLWSFGHFGEKGILVIAKEKALALTGTLSEFTTPTAKNLPAKLPEAKDSEAVAKNLLVDLVALKESGASTPTTRKDLANKLFLEAGLDKPFLFTPYQVADLRIIADSDVAKENYKKGLLDVFQKNRYPGLGNEVETWILSKGAGSSAGEEGKRALEKGYTSYQSITEGLRAMPVPESMQTSHLSILNTFKALADATRAMNLTDDLVTSLPAIQFFYQSVLAKQVSS